MTISSPPDTKYPCCICGEVAAVRPHSLCEPCIDLDRGLSELQRTRYPSSPVKRIERKART